MEKMRNKIISYMKAKETKNFKNYKIIDMK